MTEREQLEADVVIVGAGPAGLACAIRLAELMRQPGRDGTPKYAAENIIVLEKAKSVGLHSLSGAVMDVRGIEALFPDYRNTDIPLDSAVIDEELYWLTAKNYYRIPVIPKKMRNRGNYVISLGQLVRWLGEKAELLGINILTGIAANKLLLKQQQVIGVQTDDKGLDKQGAQKQNYEPGLEVRAKLTVLAEGCRGSLSKQLNDQFALDKDCNPQAYGLGLKELWEIPEQCIEPGTVWHTFGFPLSKTCSGGGWLYAMKNRRVSLGLVVGLHYSDPRFNPHNALQQIKTHPLIRRVLDGGRFLHYGAKTISQGGYWSMPRPFAPGALIVGDGAGLVDSLRLKGIHLALKSGMLAAESIHEALQSQNSTATVLAGYDEKIKASWINQDLWLARNHHQALQQKGPIARLVHLAVQGLSGGRGFFARYNNKAAYQYLSRGKFVGELSSQSVDDKISFTKSTSVYHSGTAHEQNQPSHIKLSNPEICHPQCSEEYGNPCQYFCPASVFEFDPVNDGAKLKINAANCLHCKTCDILDPYQIINWQPPEGGGGPQYESM